MANPDRPLLELLMPIFRDHAERIEAILPLELRSNWRKAARFAPPASGRKSLDHRDLLLEMAELDTDQGQPPRELAAKVLSKFTLAPGAWLDERKRVELPDGSRPALKDLIGRLARQYDRQRAELLAEVATARRLADRMQKRTERNGRKSIRVRPPNAATKLGPTVIARLTAPGNGPRKPLVTAYQVDAVLNAVRNARKKY
ncbi:hypothetical protein AAFN86_28910 [Roseomonas sp. CAU 1739]|uniref:hypothetical protein n=1 Tax=Roseomonas sp. CAU 1739 TaxID=3140364 RepID=UPI00325B3F7D